MNIEEILRYMNDEDEKVFKAVREAIPAITEAVEITVKSIINGGKMFYVGAGTSGRLGVLDASECPPTFNTDPELVKGIIAGGDTALRYPVEGAEDNEEQGGLDLENEKLAPGDVVIGIAASGITPYVIGAIKYARSLGAKTISISCNPLSKTGQFADVAIEAVVGPEIISGSTRLKSGTAQKLILNMISTTTMIKLGKTYKDLMVDLQITNKKLLNRAIKILSRITAKNPKESEELLLKANKNLKLAIIMGTTGADYEACKELLERSFGNVNRAIEYADVNGPIACEEGKNE
jgi:N-acetylmuramic acid 6-phosphate etherase